MAYKRARRMREIMANFSGAIPVEMILTPMHIVTEAKYTGRMPVLLVS